VARADRARRRGLDRRAQRGDQAGAPGGRPQGGQLTPSLTARVERFAVAGAFTIARGAKTHVDVVSCEVEDHGIVGRGEGTPVYYAGETAGACVDLLHRWRPHLDRKRVQQEFAPGAARNALDCALWDFEAQRAGVPVWKLAGLPEPRPVPTAYTVSLDTPAAMEAAARTAAARGFVLLKCKLAGDGADLDRVAAVRRGAPAARLVIDANESWAGRDIAAEAAALAALGVELVEQPLPAGADQALAELTSPLPLCADESCHTVADLGAVIARYQAVNVKLDKAGGLTAALGLARSARDAGLDVMLGCMLSTSRAIRFALPLARLARWVDLDGPALLAEDRPAGLRYRGGMILP
jgi:L-alanine-DL-glutamate epimerase-like enolase superfamily enzyme